MTQMAAILCGGLGTRLGDLTKETPKPLLNVGGKPFIEYLLFELGRRGFKEVILLAGFEHKKIIDFVVEFEKRDRFNLEIQISVEPSRAGTGGAIWNARELLHSDFLLLNGDSYFDFNYLDLCQRAALEPHNLLFFALREVEDASRYGRVELDGTEITTFSEKSRVESPGLVNAGVVFCRNAVLQHLERDCSFEQHLVPKLIKKAAVGGWRYTGLFIDIGIPFDFSSANILMPQVMTRPAVLFDRDGVLNIDTGYVCSVDRLIWVEGAVAAVKDLNDKGFYVFVVTNQAGIARGYYTEQDVVFLHSAMQSKFRENGAYIDSFVYCPHHPDGVIDRYRVSCDCRKPRPGMINYLFEEWQVDRDNSILFGDKESDIEAATAANIRGYIFSGGDLQKFVASFV